MSEAAKIDEALGMKESHRKPIAFVDVDGVLNRICSNSQAKAWGLLTTHGHYRGTRYKVHLDSDDKRRLLSLTPEFELAWGTTWENSADSQIGAKIHLPPFSLVSITELYESSKWPGVCRAAAGRPFVWFEDDKEYGHIAERYPYPYPHKIIFVDPTEGLTDENIDTAKDWLKGLT